MPLPLTDVFRQAIAEADSRGDLEGVVEDMPEKYQEALSGDIEDAREALSDDFDLTASELAEIVGRRPELKDALSGLLEDAEASSDEEISDEETPGEKAPVEDDEERCECGKKPASECDRGDDCPLSDSEKDSEEEDAEEQQDPADDTEEGSEEGSSAEDDSDEDDPDSDDSEEDDEESEDDPDSGEEDSDDDESDDETEEENEPDESAQDDVSDALAVLEDARPYLSSSFAEDMEEALGKIEPANSDSDSEAIVETLCSAAERLGAEDLAEDMTPEEVAVMIDSLASEAPAPSSGRRDPITARDLARSGGLL